MHLGAVKPHQYCMRKFLLGRVRKRASLHIKLHQIVRFNATGLTGLIKRAEITLFHIIQKKSFIQEIRLH